MSLSARRKPKQVLEEDARESENLENAIWRWQDAGDAQIW
jgi:hypothetical protein